MKKEESTPTAVIIYGAMAVGKLTVGKELAKKIGYKLTHNHLINDLILSVFERGTLDANRLIEKLRYEFYDAALKAGQNIIITHCYSHNYISPTGLSDPDYLKNIEKRIKKAGGKVLFVHLKANNKELLKRVTNDSRKQHRKLTKVSIMKEYLKAKDFTTSAHVKNNLVIDNTNLSATKTAAIIAKHLKSI